MNVDAGNVKPKLEMQTAILSCITCFSPLFAPIDYEDMLYG